MRHVLRDDLREDTAFTGAERSLNGDVMLFGAEADELRIYSARIVARLKVMIRIIPFSPEHTDGVASVILPIQQLEFEIPITLDAQPDLKDIPGYYQRGRGNFWVAVDGNEDDTVVGTIALLDIGNDQAALRKMFVVSSHRGAQRGVAAALLHTLLTWCRAHGIRTVFLGTTAKFLAAHRFYEKHGFREISRDALPPSFPVMVVDTKFYELPLQS